MLLLLYGDCSCCCVQWWQLLLQLTFTSLRYWASSVTVLYYAVNMTLRFNDLKHTQSTLRIVLTHRQTSSSTHTGVRHSDFITTPSSTIQRTRRSILSLSGSPHTGESWQMSYIMSWCRNCSLCGNVFIRMRWEHKIAAFVTFVDWVYLDKTFRRFLVLLFGCEWEIFILF